MFRTINKRKNHLLYESFTQKTNLRFELKQKMIPLNTLYIILNTTNENN